MRVALLTTFAASRKEPLAAVLQRIHAAFLSSGLGDPRILFSLGDPLAPGGISSVDRVLKRFPQLQVFFTDKSVIPGFTGVQRRLTNDPTSPAAGQSIDMQTLLAIAEGVPKSFPFYAATIHLGAASFGDGQPAAGTGVPPGVTIGDNWWATGRQRSVMGLTIVEADSGSRKLPPVPAPVAAVLAACGKAKSTKQVPLASPTPSAASPAPARGAAPTIPAQTRQAIDDVVRDYRARLADIVANASLPHDLPPLAEALATTPLGEASGPRKPALERVFKPLGYDCRSEAQGILTLRRRTAGHHTVEIYADVGTWSRSVLAYYLVHGLGFTARLPLPVAPRAMSGQYPIGGPERWQQIVDNFAALVSALDRSFVPAIEAAAGPSPAWYEPTR